MYTNVLCRVLQGYDNIMSDYLIHGFTHGFRLGCLSIPVQTNRSVTNLSSALSFPDIVDSKIQKELALGRILGPYSALPDLGRILGPYGALPDLGRILGPYSALPDLGRILGPYGALPDLGRILGPYSALPDLGRILGPYSALPDLGRILGPYSALPDLGRILGPYSALPDLGRILGPYSALPDLGRILGPYSALPDLGRILGPYSALPDLGRILGPYSALPDLGRILGPYSALPDLGRILGPYSALPDLGRILGPYSALPDLGRILGPYSALPDLGRILGPYSALPDLGRILGPYSALPDLGRILGPYSALPDLGRILGPYSALPDLGRILGPYSALPDFPNFRLSLLGVVPKKSPGKYRVIHHLSYPEGNSVNDFIPHKFSSVHYATIQDAIDVIKKSTSTIYLGKVDIESAFRIIPVSPLDTPLLGFKWNGFFYMDAVLPMRCSSSCSIFEAFSSALEWVAKTKLGITEMVHVIDDFLFLANSSKKCAADMKAFIRLCGQLGVPLAQDKTQGPDTTLPFLGITMDTLKLEARLPQDKIDKCTSLLRKFLTKPSHPQGASVPHRFFELCLLCHCTWQSFP